MDINFFFLGQRHGRVVGGFSGSPILLPFSLTLLPSVLRKGNKSGGISEVKTFLDSYNINIGKKT